MFDRTGDSVENGPRPPRHASTPFASDDCRRLTIEGVLVELLVHMINALRPEPNRRSHGTV